MRRRAGRRPGARQDLAADPSSQDLLLDAASALMIERGTTDISLSDISTRSGVNAALVRYYFGSKNGLLMALVRKVLGPSLLQAEDLQRLDTSPKEKLRIHIRGIVNTYYEHPYINRLMHHLLTDDYEVYGPMLVKEVSIPVANIQKSILEDGIAAGLFRHVDPKFVYLQIVGACDQFFHGKLQRKAIFNIGDLTEEDQARFAELLFDSILVGISQN